MSPGAAEGRERGGKGGEAQDKLAVVVDEANETAHVRARRRRRPFSDGSDLARVNRDAALGDEVAEELTDDRPKWQFEALA